jgi:hypothetical protein
VRREVLHLRWKRWSGAWGLWAGKSVLVQYAPEVTKRDAERSARRYSHGRWVDYGRPVQLFIHNKRQNIGKGGAREASYGCNSRARG